MIVDFETAKLADKVGYKEHLRCGHSYSSDQRLMGKDYTENIQSLKHKYYKAPEQSELQRWLREEHNIQIDMMFHNGGWDDVFHLQYQFKVAHPNTWHERDEFVKSDFDSYEEGLEQALKEGLKMVENPPQL